ncbi:MAG: S8 family serine peptidase, partial [Tenuifilaceae bacterium]|nr:S8 family serine peptidase [Tenuifilaceae bacterium]
WHLKKIQAELAWDITKGDPSVIIAIIDTDVDKDHPDLTTELLLPYDPYSGVAFGCSPSHGHGTAVASFATAETTEQGGVANGKLASVGFNTKFIFYHAWSGNYLQRAHHASLVMNADVLTSSAGGWRCHGNPDPIEEAAVKEILDNGTVIVMPAGNGFNGVHCDNGNDGVLDPFYPLHPVYDGRIIMVTSTDTNDYHTRIANGIDYTHSHFSSVDICAPGYDMFSAKPTYCVPGWPYHHTGSGTSYAAPIVAGVSALLKSINPNFTPGEIQHFIKSTADPVADAANYPGLLGAGRVNAFRAVALADSVANNCSPIEITTNQTWNSDAVILCGLVVKSGYQLTITSNVLLSHQSNVIIEQGATLILDGGTLSSLDNTWQGIQVWGNSTASQLTLPGQPNAQGKLVLKNDATIENAVNAVTLWKPGDWNTNGGIVVANDARFINNRRSVEFRSFQNTHPLTGEPMGNVSHFTACHFEVNDEYSIADDPFNCHISMFEVDGINLTGNSFLNQMTEGGNTGAGIISIDANYNVLAGCNSTVVPCPPADFITNHFEGFAYGIDASNSSSLTKTIYVRQAEFVNNGYGIRLNALNNATIIQNNFTVGTYEKGEWMCDTDFGIGIELAGCNNYAVEENTFTPISGLGAIPRMGIRVYNSSSSTVERNEIYFNTYDQMSRANQADGINYILSDVNLGLNYRCNKNTGNYFDFVATGQGIAGNQSSLGYAADNTFTAISLPPSDPRHFFNDAINHVTYYYRPNMPNAQPLYVYNVTPTPFGSVPPGPCSSNYGGGNEEINLQGLTESQKQHFEQELTDSHTAYTGVQSLYASLIDGGNTDAVQAEIAMAWPEDMWELRDELLGLSPLLSKDVLVSASDRTDVLPESIIFEVLSANPDELKKKELMEHLETKDNPLPAYMIEILESLTGSVTYKTILQSQMAHYGRMEGRAAGILLRDMLRDSTTTPESIRTFMAERQSLPMDMQRVDSYLESGETAQALALAAGLPQQYALDGEALAEHGRFVQLKQLQAGLHDQGRNIFQLTPTEKEQLEALVEQSTGAAGRQARSILAFVYEEEFCDCPADINPELKAKTFVQPPLDKLDEAQISVHPNPAKTWVSFDYTIPGSSSNANLEIRDATGKLVYQTTLENKQGQYVWDTRDIAPGLYYYTMKTTHGIKSGKVTVVR